MDEITVPPGVAYVLAFDLLSNDREDVRRADRRFERWDRSP